MAAEGIVILGAGPAGAAAAIGLARMGEPVVLVGEPRRFAAVEGVSARVVEALRGLGLQQALQAFAPPSPRRAVWNGAYAEANVESLVDRQRFDRGVLDDLEHLGVAVVRGRVTALRSTPGRHELEIDTEAGPRSLVADFLVEARGRAAPGGGAARGLRRAAPVHSARDATRKNHTPPALGGTPGQVCVCVIITE